MKRGIGCSRTFNTMRDKERVTKISEELTKKRFESHEDVLHELKITLEEFVKKYGKLINEDPIFRLKFLQMCDAIGINPHACDSSFWSKTLGLKRFYSELIVRVIDICIKKRIYNGGLCEITECLNLLPQNYKITKYDIIRVLKECEIFGRDNISLMQIQNKIIIVTNPNNMTIEKKECLSLACKLQRGVTVAEIAKNTNWTVEKSIIVINKLIREQIVWIDTTETITPNTLPINTYFWFPIILS